MVCVDHLLWDLPNFPPVNVHYGWLHCNTEDIVYIDEGVSMFSNDVIEKFLSQKADKILCHPYGDQQISIWEQELGLDETGIIRSDNDRIHHSPPASYYPPFKKMANLCDHYIALHGVYKKDMYLFWKKRGHGTHRNYSRYSEIKTSKICPYKPYLNWTITEGMYRQQPRPCSAKPKWQTRTLHQGREGR